jgi:hypothetical protein
MSQCKGAHTCGATDEWFGDFGIRHWHCGAKEEISR